MSVVLSVFSSAYSEGAGTYSKCFARSSLCNAHHVPATESQWEPLCLNGCGLLEILLQQYVHHVLYNTQTHSHFAKQHILDNIKL